MPRSGSRLFHTLDALERDHGFFFNYYDTTSLERTSNLLSFVDSSWLIAGLVVVRNRHRRPDARATRADRRDGLPSSSTIGSSGA
ncbi:MAG: hypothetical protein U0610_31110 [bacterium]